MNYVRELGISCTQAASVADLQIPDGSLDVVTVLDCNYYWPSQNAELRAIHAALKPGGLLAIRTVDTNAAIAIADWLRHWLPAPARRLGEYAVYDHRVSIPATSLLRVVERCGFDIIHASPRDGVQFARNSPRVRIAYAVGELVWTVGRYNLAPGFVFIARKAARQGPVS